MTLEKLLQLSVYSYLFIVLAKVPEPKGASHYPAFVSSCPFISPTFFALSTKWMSSPSRKWGRGSVHDLSYCNCVWYESGELGGRRSLRFPCVSSVVEVFSSEKVAFRNPSNINDAAPLRRESTALTCRLFPEKKLHQRLPTGFQTRIWLEVLLMWGLDGLQVHVINSRSVLYKEFVVVRLNYKKSYFWWLVIWLGVTRLKRTRVLYLLDFFEGRRENGQCYLVRVECLQMIGLMVVM